MADAAEEAPRRSALPELLDDRSYPGLAVTVTEIDETRRKSLGAARRGTLVAPHNVEAEESLLGAALLSAEAVSIAVETLRPDDFYKPANRQIFEAILVLWGEGAPVDAMTVSDVLNRFGYLDNIGGLPALLSLETRTPATTNAARYARIVQDHATLRNLQTLAGTIVEEVAELPTDIEAVISGIRGRLEEISLPGGRADPGPSIFDFIYDEDAEEDDWIVPDLLERSDRVILTGPEGRGKALDVETPIPTPFGWTKLGEIRPGSWVFAPDGLPVRVVAVSEVWNDRPCYEVEFDDGWEIVADAEHEWLTWSVRARESARAARTTALAVRGTDQTERRTRPSIVTTREIRETLNVRASGVTNHSIPTCDPLRYPTTVITDEGVDDRTALPVDPYVLGAWLGDGTTSDGSITTADPEIVEEIRRAGYEVRKRNSPYRWGIPGLRVQLRSLGVLGRKHIPNAYMRASVEQRIALLQGLMDTDGTVGVDGRCEFSVCNSDLADDVDGLLSELGFKVGESEGPAKLNGRVVGVRRRLRFCPAVPVFRLPRKAERQRSTFGSGYRTQHRYVVDVRPVPSRPVRCIQVASADGLFVAGLGCIPTHNSTMIRQLGVQVAAGAEPFSFGRPIPPMRVMLVDAENPSPVLRRELRKLYLAAGSALDPERFTVLSRPEGLDLLHRGDRQWLLERLQANAPDVVMIGPLYKLHREDPNDEQAARSLSAFLDDVRIRYRFALIVEAHQPQTASGKTRLIRPVGSSLWLRWPEMGVALVPDGDEETARVWKLKEWRGLRSSRVLPQRLIRGGHWPWMTGETHDQQAF